MYEENKIADPGYKYSFYYSGFVRNVAFNFMILSGRNYRKIHGVVKLRKAVC